MLYALALATSTRSSRSSTVSPRSESNARRGPRTCLSLRSTAPPKLASPARSVATRRMPDPDLAQLLLDPEADVVVGDVQPGERVLRRRGWSSCAPRRRRAAGSSRRIAGSRPASGSWSRSAPRTARARGRGRSRRAAPRSRARGRRSDRRRSSIRASPPRTALPCTTSATRSLPHVCSSEALSSSRRFLTAGESDSSMITFLRRAGPRRARRGPSSHGRAGHRRAGWSRRTARAAAAGRRRRRGR